MISVPLWGDGEFSEKYLLFLEEEHYTEECYQGIYE